MSELALRLFKHRQLQAETDFRVLPVYVMERVLLRPQSRRTCSY